jgi:hypothetical protein
VIALPASEIFDVTMRWVALHVQLNAVKWSPSFQCLRSSGVDIPDAE